MGSTTFLDIISSTTMFGFLLLIVLRLNAGTNESNSGYYASYLLQSNMIALTTLLEDDLKHVGSGVYDQDGGIQHADWDSLRFREVFPGKTTASTVEWKFEASVPPGVQNTRIHYISRSVDGVKTMMNLGVSSFTIQYYRIDVHNTLITPLPIVWSLNNATGNIGPICVTIRLESPFRPPSQYLAAADTSAYQMVWREIRSVSRNNSVQFPNGF
jgi:hypothetical protein